MKHVSWNVPHDPLHPTDTECMEICDDHEWKCPYGKVCERHEDTLEEDEVSPTSRPLLFTMAYADDAEQARSQIKPYWLQQLERFSLMGWLCVPKWHHGTTHTDAVTADEPEEEQS